MRTLLDSMMTGTDSFVACVVRNLGYRWQEWRRGPERYVDLDRRRQMWRGTPVPYEARSRTSRARLGTSRLLPLTQGARVLGKVA
jgi:hypothetical protein